MAAQAALHSNTPGTMAALRTIMHYEPIALTMHSTRYKKNNRKFYFKHKHQAVPSNSLLGTWKCVIATRQRCARTSTAPRLI
jgi:hypothetical protein